MTDVKFGPSGETVFRRTYSRPKPNGDKETWVETAHRVAYGNLALVHGDNMDAWPVEALAEYAALTDHIIPFKIIPAGRHLWASGVKGRQFLMNCWTSGWTERFSDHFEFTFMRLMEGGGVGANYSTKYIEQYGAPKRTLNLHVVADSDHQDYPALADVLSSEYSAEWVGGAFEVEDSREGWAAALVDLIDTFYAEDVKHENRVYDVSRVRPAGARLKTFGGTASGPKPFAEMLHTVARILNEAASRGTTEVIGSLQRGVVRTVYTGPTLTPLDCMEIDHAIAECVVSGGVRRSARMSIVRWDDPWVEEFIKAKQDSGLHWTTNISVEVDDEFFRALAGEAGRFPAGVHGSRPKSVVAKRVHQMVTEGMLTNGEPGYWNSSLSNHGEVQEVYATNPCGEITLQMFEACNLGHVNMDAFAPKAAGDSIDEGGLILAHQLVTRFLIRATYADITDSKSRVIQDMNRRIGVGHLGVQGFVVKNGWRYSDVAVNSLSPGYHQMRNLLGTLYSVVRQEARTYAFALRIPEPVKVTTVAPTGSVAKLPGATEGIHPILFRYFEQRIRFSSVDADQMAQVEEARLQGFKVEDAVNEANTVIVVYPTKNILVEQVEALGYPADIVEQADEIDMDAMLGFQAMYQRGPDNPHGFADNAVSFTVNIPAEEHQNDYLRNLPESDPFGQNIPGPTEERRKAVAETILKWLPLLKGTTIMLDGSRTQAPYTSITEEQYERSTGQSTLSDDIDLDCATGACPVR